VAGGRATVGFRPGIVGIEVLSSSRTNGRFYDSVFDPTGRLASPFTPIGVAPNAIFDNNTIASVAYTSELQSAELNLTWLLYGDVDGEATCKFGLRGMAIDEQFNYSATNTIGTTSLSFTTDNRLIGPQLGFGRIHVFPRGMLGLNCLGGYAYNQIDRTEVFNGAPLTFNTTEGAFFGELGIEYVFTRPPISPFDLGTRGSA